MRVLVCGGRYLDSTKVWNWLKRFGHQDATDALGHSQGRITCIIHGSAWGADQGAGLWGESENIPVRVFPADWAKHGRSAGPIRNTRMIAEGKPDLVMAFPGGRGTDDMCRQAEAAGIPVRRIERTGR